MDFTREPIIETVITPKEGCKLVVRSSKNTAQEEYFVDAIEVVSFGHSFFFRSLERPKAFLVPVSDYEVLEVREARMVLKNVGIDRTIKIGGGRDAQMRGGVQREHISEKMESGYEEPVTAVEGQTQTPQAETKPVIEPRLDKKRDRRRQYRRRRGREEGGLEGGATEETPGSDDKELAPRIELPEPRKFVPGEEPLIQPITTASILTSLLPPPPTLISETIARYKDNALFRGAFYSKEDLKSANEGTAPVIPIEQPEYGSFEVSEEEEERIYQQRKQHSGKDEREGRSQDDEKSQEQTPMEPDEKGPEFDQESLEDSFLPGEPSQSSSEEDEIKNENHQK